VERNRGVFIITTKGQIQSHGSDDGTALFSIVIGSEIHNQFVDVERNLLGSSRLYKVF